MNYPASAEEQSSNFQLTYNEKTAAASAAQLTKCILLHAYSRTTASSQLRENKQNFIAYLTSWQTS